MANIVHSRQSLWQARGRHLTIFILQLGKLRFLLRSTPWLGARVGLKDPWSEHCVWIPVTIVYLDPPDPTLGSQCPCTSFVRVMHVDSQH